MTWYQHYIDSRRNFVIRNYLLVRVIVWSALTFMIAGIFALSAASTLDAYLSIWARESEGAGGMLASTLRFLFVEQCLSFVAVCYFVLVIFVRLKAIDVKISTQKASSGQKKMEVANGQ